MGLGTQNVVGVRTDSRGKMDPEALEAEILKTVQDGGKPFMVVATCGMKIFNGSAKSSF